MKKKIIITILVSSILIICLVIGSIIGINHYLDKAENHQHKVMINYVKKYHTLIEDELRESDKNNFITKITINYKTVEHNPMGGIDVEGYVNNDKSLEFSGGIDKYTVENKTRMESTGLVISRKLDKKLGNE